MLLLIIKFKISLISFKKHILKSKLSKRKGIFNKVKKSKKSINRKRIRSR